MSLDKLAQRRSLLSKIREKVSPIGHAMEGVSSEFSSTMDQMRTIDAEAREIATDTRDLIRYAKTFLRQSDYIKAGANVVAFHDRCARINAKLSQFGNNLNDTHTDYFLNSFDDPDARSKFLNYDPDAVKAAAESFEKLVKEAIPGPSDIYYKARDVADAVGDPVSKLLSGDGRGRMGLDKSLNTGFYKLVKSATAMIVTRSDRMFSDLLKCFNNLESGVSRRKPEVYLKWVGEFQRKYAAYDSAFRPYYEQVIIPLRKRDQALNDGKSKDRAEMAGASDEAQIQNLLDSSSLSDSSGLAPGRPSALESRREMPSELPVSTPVTESVPKGSGRAYLDMPEMPSSKNTITEEPTLVSRPKLVEPPRASGPSLNLVEPPRVSDAPVMLPVSQKMPPVPGFGTKKVEPPALVPGLPKVTNPKKHDPLYGEPDFGEPGVYQSNSAFDDLEHQYTSTIPKSKAAHQLFMNKMTKLAKADDADGMVKAILNHSELIQDVDPEAAARLLRISSQILEKKK